MRLSGCCLHGGRKLVMRVMRVVRMMRRCTNVKRLMLRGSVAPVPGEIRGCGRRTWMRLAVRRVVVSVMGREHRERVIIGDHVLIQQPLLTGVRGKSVPSVLVVVVMMDAPVLPGMFTVARIHRAKVTRRRD